MNFSIKERQENDLIKHYPETPKRGQFHNLLFSITVQPVRINDPGLALPDGTGKSVGVARIIEWTFGTWDRHRFKMAERLQ